MPFVAFEWKHAPAALRKAMAAASSVASHQNRLDLIRLVAAVQVMLSHCFSHLGYGETAFAALISLFPGVPIFFVVSGYLVSQSYDQCRNLADYGRRRFNRIFPALWGALAFSAATVLLLHPIEVGTFLLWIVAQATLLQDWHPDALRTYGVGVVNGSLWSIPVELSFYVALPVVALFRTRWLVGLAAVSFSILYVAEGFVETFAGKLVLASPLPWIGMFLAGVLAYRAQWRPSVKLWAPLFAAVTAASLLLAENPLLHTAGNFSGVLNFAALAGLTFALAFSGTLRLPVDLSYGIYLYHMPVLNAALSLGLAGAGALTTVVAVSAAMAMLSWAAIERKMATRRRAVRKDAPAALELGATGA